MEWGIALDKQHDGRRPVHVLTWPMQTTIHRPAARKAVGTRTPGWPAWGYDLAPTHSVRSSILDLSLHRRMVQLAASSVCPCTNNLQIVLLEA